MNVEATHCALYDNSFNIPLTSVYQGKRENLVFFYFSLSLSPYMKFWGIVKISCVMEDQLVCTPNMHSYIDMSLGQNVVDLVFRCDDL